MIGLDNRHVVFGRGVTPSKDPSDPARALARLADLLSLEEPEWYVLMMAGDTDDQDKRSLVPDGFAPLDRSPEAETDPRFVVCFISPKDISSAEWAKVRAFHEDHGREGSPIFVGHSPDQKIESSPIWLDTDVVRGATYIVDRFLFHALVEIE